MHPYPRRAVEMPLLPSLETGLASLLMAKWLSLTQQDDEKELDKYQQSADNKG